MKCIKTAQYEEEQLRQGMDSDQRVYLRVLYEIENSLYRIQPASPIAESGTEQAKADVRNAIAELRKQALSRQEVRPGMVA